MQNVTEILNAAEGGDPAAAERLVPLAYDELRRIAADKMAGERTSHTLQPTALVHEAWIRLLGPDGEQQTWNSRGHFFSAAAEAMRRILIDGARRKMSQKRGERPDVTEFDEAKFETDVPSERLLAVHEALTQLESEHAEFARIVKLRYFADMTVPEIAALLETSVSTVNRTWKSAKAWLYREIGEI